MKRCLIACALVTIATSTPGQSYQQAITCKAADYNIMLDLYLPLAKDGSGNAARGMRGELRIAHQKVPKERRVWPLDDKLPAQFWNVGNDIKIRLLLAQGEQLVDLVIEAQRRSQNAGSNATFRLETAEGVKVQGKLGCSASD